MGLRMLFIMLFCQESPRWLIIKSRREEALKALNKIRPEHDFVNGLTAAEVEAVAVAVDDAGADQGRWVDLFRGNYFRRSSVSPCIPQGSKDSQSANRSLDLHIPAIDRKSIINLDGPKPKRSPTPQ